MASRILGQTTIPGRLLPLRLRVRLVVLLLQVLNADVGVLLGRRKAFVPEQLLDAAQIRATLQQVRCKAVAQRMRRDAPPGLQPESHAREQTLDVPRRNPAWIFPHAEECG